MKKHWLAALLALAVFAAGPAAEFAQAQRRGGSSFSGRSYSPGRSISPSTSRPSSSGRSYSSGGRSATPSRPSAPAPRPSSPSTPRPSAPGTSAPRPSTPGFSSPSGKTYSPGPSTTRPPAAPGPFGPSTRPSTPSGKSYSPGNPGGTVATPSRPAPGKPGGAPFDAAAGTAQQRAESKRAYTAGKEPKPTYTTPAGKPKQVDPTDRRVETLRRELNHERWVNREMRQRSYFGPYYSYPFVTYHDPFSNLFWWWLISQSLDTRAHWAYHHRHEMDDARYREMVRRDAQLEERVRQLEAKGVKRDPAYVPKEIEPDLMYTDEFVDSVYNPQPTGKQAPPYAPPAAPRNAPSRAPSFSLGSFIWAGLMFFLRAMLVLFFIAVVIWLVFFKRWGGR